MFIQINKETREKNTKQLYFKGNMFLALKATQIPTYKGYTNYLISIELLQPQTFSFLLHVCQITQQKWLVVYDKSTYQTTIETIHSP